MINLNTIKIKNESIEPQKLKHLCVSDDAKSTIKYYNGEILVFDILKDGLSRKYNMQFPYFEPTGALFGYENKINTSIDIEILY